MDPLLWVILGAFLGAVGMRATCRGAHHPLRHGYQPTRAGTGKKYPPTGGSNVRRPA